MTATAPPISPRPSAPPAKKPWHALTVPEALEAESVDPAVGLSATEVEARRATFGLNKFAETAKEPRWQTFVRQYRDPMQVVLLVAGGGSPVLSRQLSPPP